MPTSKEHDEKFKHNISFINYLKDSPYGDWLITACFYSALHLVQSCLHDKFGITDSQLCDHVVTKNMVHQYIPEAIVDYNGLLSLSYTTRYKSTNSINRDDISDAEQYLQNVIDVCNSLYNSHNRFQMA